jgi:Flp pilus assembly pilin Flp
MQHTWRQFLADETGAEMVEYILLTLVILAFTLLAMIAIGQKLQQIFNNILEQLQRVPSA